MLRFNVGDKVRLVRPSEAKGWYGIDRNNKTGIGEEFEVKWKKRGISDGGEYEIGREGMCWMVFDDMLDPAKPLSPFDQSVQDYIRSETSQCLK